MTDPITVPLAARQAMQKALWERCIQPADNEWTTWTDAIILAEAAATALWEAGWAVVPAKQEHKGPRAQVITPSDGVLTREGQILAVALHAAEERELDLLAKIGRLERLIDGEAT